MADATPTRRVDDRQLAVARVYARALLELAEERGESEALDAELQELAAFLGAHPRFTDYLAAGADAAARRALLERLFRGRASDLLIDALQVISRKERLAILPALAHAFREALDEKRNRVDVWVRSALPLAAEQRARLAATASRRTGREARLHEEVDPELVGGLIVRIGDRKLDHSVARQLDRLLADLLERASAEITSGRGLAVAGE
jgi:F-type H+-transporting ATPase subunit delta